MLRERRVLRQYVSTDDSVTGLYLVLLMELFILIDKLDFNSNFNSNFDSN